jgi:hypothetical protein
MSPLGKNARTTNDGCGIVALRVALAIVLFAILALVPASPATAATVFHVAPGGLGGACTVAAPCNIVDALTKLAKAGDVVQVAGNQGTYGLPNSPTMANIVVGQEVTLEGEPGAADAGPLHGSQRPGSRTRVRGEARRLRRT